MVEIKNFKELNKSDVTIAGGKGASLGEMTQAGIPVPPGFVVLTTAFDQFIEETGLKAEIDSILHTVNHHEIHTGEFASEKIRALILGKDMPPAIADEIITNFEELGVEYVAVRSSASAEDGSEAAWAGQLESYLNTTKNDLLEKVKLCWSSLFTPRAIFYRFEKGFHGQHISVAVVVQKMVASEISGIAFSVHPVTQDYNQSIIEAGYGLGEAIVSGQITPDNYIVEKDQRQILEKHVSEQERGLFRVEGGGNEWREIEKEKGTEQKLTDDQVLELADIVIGIEQHYGFPVDIEWAYETGKFYVVQSRPITTLQPAAKARSWNSPELQGFDPKDYEFHGLWKSTVLIDYFWTFIFCEDLAKELDFPLNDTGAFKFNEGNYFTKRSTTKILHDRVMKAIAEGDEKFFERLKEVIDREFTKTKTEIDRLAKLEPTAETIAEVTSNLKRVAYLESLGYQISYAFEKELLSWAEREGIRDAELTDYIPTIRTPLLDRQEELKELKTVLTDQKILELPDEEALQTIRKDPQLADKFAKHIEKFGWVEIISFSGEKTTPERLLEIIKHFEPVEHQRRELKNLSEEAQVTLTAASYISYMREIGAEYFAMCTLELRPLLFKMADKLAITYQEMQKLTPEEIADFIQQNNTAGAKALIEKRSNGKWALLEGPNCEAYVIDDAEDIQRMESEMLPKEATSDEIVGQVGFAGIAQGKVKIVLDSNEFGKMKKGDVLVTTMTTPDFVTLMQIASAIVTDIGGLLSHAAIVSRELQKPCIIGTKHATQILKDGDLVEVDANIGMVRKLNKSDSLKKEDWTYWGQWIQPALSAVPQMYWGHTAALQTLHSEHKFHSLLYLDGHFWGFTSDLQSIKEKAKDIFNRKSFAESNSTLETIFKEYSDRYLSSVKSSEPSPSNYLKVFFDLHFEIGSLWSWVIALGDELGNQMVEQGFAASEEDILSRLGEVTKETWLEAQSREIHEFAAKLKEADRQVEPGDLNPEYLKKIPELLTAIERHATEYKWFGTHHWLGEELTTNDVISQIKDALASPNSSQHKTRKTADDPAWQLLASAAYWRTHIAEVIAKAVTDARPHLEEVATKLKLTYDQLVYLSPKEILSSLESDNHEELINMVIARQEGYGCYLNDGQEVIITGSELSESLEKMLDRTDGDDTEEIKGTPANKAEPVRGKVIIVTSPKDFSKFVNGSILVSPETTPDFVPLMKGALAIVTDQGGITSHAAIVSRELNKPCVIGTKVATQILKDGDLVEVDANNGIVRIINGTVS